MERGAGRKAHVIVINEKDNVAVALEDIPAGSTVLLPDGRELEARSDIPESHKMAIRRIGRGEPVIKYGEVIASAREDLEEGEWVHTHNIATG